MSRESPATRERRPRPAAPVAPLRRWAFPLAVAGLVVLALVALWAVGGRVSQAIGSPARSVTVSGFEAPGTPSDRHEVTEIYDVAPGTTLSEALAGVTFPRTVDLLVVFTDVASWDFTPDTPHALPTAAVQLAATRYPELMDETAGRIGPDTLILAIDPASGQTAAVAGEGLGLAIEDTDRIAAAMTPEASTTSWPSAPTSGAELAGTLMPPPWQRPEVLAPLASAALLVLVGALVVPPLRRRTGPRTRALREGVQALREDWEREEAAVPALPEDSPAAAAALAAHRDRGRRIDRLAAAVAGSPPLRTDDPDPLRTAERRLAALQAPHEPLAATADLLWRRGDWESTWRARWEDVRCRIAARPEPAAWRAELDALDADVRARRFSVDEGLRRLAEIETGGGSAGQ